MTRLPWYGLPEFETEYKFHPTRQWRFDYAWPQLYCKIAVEIEGGMWTNGRHTRGSGFKNDMEKYNVAAFMGWLVFRFTPEQLKKGIALSFMMDVFKASH